MDIIDKKIEFIKSIEKVGVRTGTYKLRFIKKGKYGESEAWIYHNPNPKWQKMNSKGNYLIYPNGEPVMENRTGYLLEEETIKNLEYLKEYLCDFIHR